MATLTGTAAAIADTVSPRTSRARSYQHARGDSGDQSSIAARLRAATVTSTGKGTTKEKGVPVSPHEETFDEGDAPEPTSMSMSAESADVALQIEAEPVEAPGEDRLHVHLLFMMSLMLFQAVCVSLAVGVGFLEVDWGQLGMGTILLVVAEVTRRTLWSWARSAFLKCYVGLSDEQVRDINGPRLNLPSKWLTDLLASPKQKCRIKITDVLFRKGGHVFTLTFTLFFTSLFGDHGAVVFSLSLGALVLIVAQAAAVWFGPRDGGGVWRLYFLLWGASDRIRDGRFGMRNAMGGSVSMMWGVSFAYIITLAGLGKSVDDDPENEEFVPGLWELISPLILMPLSYGDAMGEIIGTPFGGRYFWKFRVRGFGEINQKSIEGCIAVFFGSLIPCLITVGTSAEGAKPNAWILCFLISCLTTATETFSFRSTDNFVIPVCNAVFVVLWWHLAKSGGLMKDE